MTLIEILVSGVILGVLLTLFITLFGSMFKAQAFTSTMPSVQADTADTLNALAQALRRAPICESSAGCTGLSGSAFDVASANTFTLYRTAAGPADQFTVVNGRLRTSSTVTQGSGLTGSSGTLTLSFAYLTNAGGAYLATGDPAAATWVTSVTGAARANISAVRITVQHGGGGLVGTYSTIVRLRNSPKKLKPSD